MTTQKPEDLAAEFCNEQDPDKLLELVRAVVAEQSHPVEFVGVREACDRLGWSRSSFDRDMADKSTGLGEVVGDKVNRRYRIPWRDIEQWFNQKRGRRGA